jgi:ELWxxDGT repeat protein
MVVFEGLDANNGIGPNQFGLWVTDGTAAGTHEITGISNVYSGAGGLFGGPNGGVAAPPDFTVLHNEVLFNGVDAAAKNGLWVTDGTAAGTHELAVISGANASGVDPFDLTVFNHEVLFNGNDSSGDRDRGLWVTDGTAASTHELTGISGANAAGVNPSDLTVFKGKILFNGIDAAGKNGLWVTNGTAGGTHEITGIVGADPNGLNPSDLTVFKNVVLFDGYDSSGKTGLWVTNGTAAGTHELTVADAYTGLVGPFSHPGGLLPLGLTSVTLPDLKRADTFNFAADLGSSTNANSNIHDDTIGLPSSEFADLAALMADAHPAGTNTVTHDGHDGAALDHLAQSLSHASNFHLV